MRVPLLPLLLLLAACGGSDGDTDAGPADSCDACGDDEVCVVHMDESGDRESCAPIPDTCGDVASCGDDPCRGALYELCDPDWLGVGCSDGFAPTIVSCNP